MPAYRTLRARNPAPFAALLRLGEVSVLSSSPERFLRVDRDAHRRVAPDEGHRGARCAEPIADACRAAELRRDEKTRAENLMIADLVRNDLGRVSRLGSVEVPRLMVVESHATVHQMVTVVRGRLRDDADAIDCVRAAFPAGSMTGAPKLRTLEIIDRLEGRPRGVYSGALGFLAVNGTADLSVVIRTLVASPRRPDRSAPAARSSPPPTREAELEEMLLKARPLLEAVGGTLDAGGRGRRRGRARSTADRRATRQRRRSSTNGARHRANGTSASIRCRHPLHRLRSTSGSERLNAAAL